MKDKKLRITGLFLTLIALMACLSINPLVSYAAVRGQSK